MSYFTPILGDWVADRTGGYRRAIEWGAFLLALSQLLLFAGASVDPASGLTTARTLTFAALFLIVVGNGLFKPNITSELSRIHASRPDAMDVAFSNYYLFLSTSGRSSGSSSSRSSGTRWSRACETPPPSVGATSRASSRWPSAGSFIDAVGVSCLNQRHPVRLRKKMPRLRVQPTGRVARR